MQQQKRQVWPSIISFSLACICFSCSCHDQPVIDEKKEEKCGPIDPKTLNLYWSNDTLYTSKYFDYLNCRTNVPLIVRGTQSKLSYGPNWCGGDLTIVVSVLDSSYLVTGYQRHAISLYLFSIRKINEYSSAPLRRLVIQHPDSVITYECVRVDTSVVYGGWPF